MKNYFTSLRSVIKEALIQRGSTVWTIDSNDFWTIDSNDLPTDESMGIFCDSLIEKKRVSWEAEGKCGLSRGMVKVTFRVEAWEKLGRPVMLALRPESRSPQV